ncbi:MAG TPA: oligopeptide/dipeptide ABC transporter ATP-binding protein [Aggregatilineaceae bacterium]|nr:oligopeptide/dipeptide ABC transporter ATP-binding protein [Aggregatilineaceae bacterium]
MTNLAASEKNLLEVRNLKMWFAKRSGFLGRDVSYIKAVDDVNFYIQRGETLGLVGESGCGKTTIGRCIVRAYQPTAGEILYYTGDAKPGESDQNTVDLAQLAHKDLRRYRQEIRMIFQDPYSSLNPRMTVFEIVAEVLRVNQLASGRELEERVAQLLQRVGLRPEYMRRYPHAFSGGERQRIVIARALATNPRLIVADEAISALDVSIRAQILNLLEDLQEELGLTYLFIAHDLSVVRHICDRVNVMYVGKLVESAEATSLYTQPKHPYTEALMSAVPIHNPRSRGSKQRIRLEGDVADPANPPSGCYFHPRCRYAQERCKHEEPALRPVESGSPQPRFVACH